MAQLILRSLFVLTFCSLLPSLCAAQVMRETKLEGQPLIYLKNGKPNACGIRIIGLEESPTWQGPYRSIDVSVNVSASGLGMVKGASQQLMAPDAGQEREPTRIPVESVWLRAKGKAATTPHEGKSAESPTDPGARLYVATLESALSIFNALMEEQPIQIGLRRAGEKVDRIYFGRIEMSAGELNQVSDCLKDLAAVMGR